MIPNLSVIWIVGLVLLLAGILNRLLFRPIGRVVADRERAVASAIALAESALKQADTAGREYESALAAVRTEGYKQMDERRRGAFERRAAVLDETRREAQASLTEATSRMQTQTSEARQRLRHEADALATLIVERVLDRKAS